MMNPQEIVSDLCSPRKVDRENGINNLEKILSKCSLQDRITLENSLVQLLTQRRVNNLGQDSDNSDAYWETIQGCLAGAKVIIPFVEQYNEKESEFTSQIKAIAEKCLTDMDVRVRTEAGAVLGVLCQKLGPDVYKDVRDYLIELIQNNLDRSCQEKKETEDSLIAKLAGPTRNMEIKERNELKEVNNSELENLETSMLCLQAMVHGCGSNFQLFIDQELLALIFQTLTHPNKFVRETGFYLCSALVRCTNKASSVDKEKGDNLNLVNPIFASDQNFSKYLSRGLDDSWSQVRLAACHATRNFLLSLPKSNRDRFYPELLPRICLNRYYIAEGVSNYFLETWRQVTGEYGKELVQKFIEPTVKYYQEVALSDNLAVREATCSSIGELALKIDSNVVRPYVPSLVNSLLTCFQDNSWTVRDAACVACGNFILSFPKECQPSMETLYPLFFRNLGDPVASVRQGAATALTHVAQSYSSLALHVIMNSVNKALKDVSTQSTEDVGESRRANSHYSAVRQRRYSDSHLLTDSKLYSRGSLISKHRDSQPLVSKPRESQPWEKADGSVILLGKLSEMKEAHISIMTSLPLVAEACRIRHYSNHIVFLETVCRHLPTFAKNLGAKQFKTVLDLFIDPVFISLTSENALTSSAASQCLNQLGSLIGISVLRARVCKHNPRYVEHLDANVFIAPF